MLSNRQQPVDTEKLYQEESMTPWDVLNELKEFRELAEDAYGVLAEQYENLCSDGQAIMARLRKLLGKPNEINRAVSINFTIESFKLPADSEGDDYDAYLITITDKNGKVLFNSIKPDSVEYA